MSTTVRALTARQRTALELLARNFVSTRTAGSMPSLVQRGLAVDYGRYYASRGHNARYEITDAGSAELSREEAAEA